MRPTLAYSTKRNMDTTANAHHEKLQAIVENTEITALTATLFLMTNDQDIRAREIIRAWIKDHV